MNSRLLSTFVSLCLLISVCHAEEKFGRGFIAVRRPDGRVYLGWRLLDSDLPRGGFNIARQRADRPGEPAEFINKDYIRTTNFLDGQVYASGKYVYSLFDSKSTIPIAQTGINISKDAKPYFSIRLSGNYDFKNVGIADLDGDGWYEYIIRQPNFNTDPYQRPGYWKKSPTTYKIEAYNTRGKMLWRYDMGWSIEAGTWYAPWIVYDVDGDGKAEVYCKAGEGDPRNEKGIVESGPEYLVKLEGMTGKIVNKTDWLSRDGFEGGNNEWSPPYNYYCRNFLAVSYLDGKKPSLVMQRGTYNLIKSQALDKDFNRIWYWDTGKEQKKYRGQGSHGLISADIDYDGKDELVIGAAVLDDNGRGLWTLEMGHPDVCYVADINPGNPGLEIFYGFETKQKTDGLCVVDAKTGKKLWAHKQPTQHLHGQGMAADVLAEYPGMEVYAAERDIKEDCWLYSADGELIKRYTDKGTTPRAVWWDDDDQKEICTKGAVCSWDKQVIQKIEGKVVAIADCLGDWREEVIVALDGELRIYTSTIPSSKARKCLMLDRQYRLGIANMTMGYYYPAQLSRNFDD